MAAVIGIGLRGLCGLRQTVGRQVAVGTWLHSQKLSTSPTGSPKIYEMRTYYVKPKAFAEFMQLTYDYIHLKADSNSKLNGYWTSDIGGLNEVTHIWEYDSYTEKMEAQKSLLQDETWVNNYRKKILKMLVKQDNLVMNPFPWFDVKPPLSIGGVYELRMYDLILGKKEQWEHRFIQGFVERCKLSEPVGVWFTEFGPINRVVMLWPYQSLDDRTKIRKDAQGLEEWVEAIRDCLPFEKKAFSKVLIPTQFSPWK